MYCSRSCKQQHCKLYCTQPVAMQLLRSICSRYTTVLHSVHFIVLHTVACTKNPTYTHYLYIPCTCTVNVKCKIRHTRKTNFLSNCYEMTQALRTKLLLQIVKSVNRLHNLQAMISCSMFHRPRRQHCLQLFSDYGLSPQAIACSVSCSIVRDMRSQYWQSLHDYFTVQYAQHKCSVGQASLLFFGSFCNSCFSSKGERKEIFS